MASIKHALRSAAHNALIRRRGREHDKALQKKFEQHCKTLGVQATWEDYARARQQISCSLDEYFAFEFYERKDPELRDSFMTLDRQSVIAQKIGDVDQSMTILGSKLLFDDHFDAFLKREWLNPTAASAQQFTAFLQKHGRVIVKPATLCSGKGITAHNYQGEEDALRLYDELYGSGAVVEQMLVQHEDMNRLNPHCVNSVRVLTYTDRDEVHILLATARTGAGDGIVDNFGAGGLSMAVDWKSGAIIADGIDQDFRRVAKHPLTGTQIKGFQIPNWDKAIDIVERAARLAYTLPQCRWIGWDLAFLADGDVAIIEGNWRPGTLAQNTHPRGIYHELKELSKKL